MKCTITRKKDLVVSKWKSGSTTQLFLYPPTAEYTERNFQLRISSATVEKTPSTFTNLPGFRRLLMPLNAPLKLIFENHGETELNPLESVEFDGSWNTVSHGLCTDLGIMLAAGWRGKLTVVGNGDYKCAPGFMGLYSLDGGLRAIAADEEHTLMQGDFLLLELEAGINLRLNAPEKKAAILIQCFPLTTEPVFYSQQNQQQILSRI
jgi:environmental stress-induced protein Ves